MKRAVVLILLLLLIACGSEEPKPETEPPFPVVTWHRGRITIVTLPDGTRCAAMWEATGHGLDCDWGEN